MSNNSPASIQSVPDATGYSIDEKELGEVELDNENFRHQLVQTVEAMLRLYEEKTGQSFFVSIDIMLGEKSQP